MPRIRPSQNLWSNKQECLLLGSCANRTRCRLWLGQTETQLQGLFRIYILTKFGRLTSRVSPIVAVQGLELVHSLLQVTKPEPRSVCL